MKKKCTQLRDEMPENIEYQALTIHPVELAGIHPKTKANPRPESSAIDPPSPFEQPVSLSTRILVFPA
jgi:hypothetical protein